MSQNDFVDTLNLHLKLYSEKIDSQYSDLRNRIETNQKITCDKLDSIDRHLERQNGRIAKTEDKINDLLINKKDNQKDHEKIESEFVKRGITCPVKGDIHNEIKHVKTTIKKDIEEIKDDVRTLKNENFTKSEIKKYMLSGLALIITLLTIMTLTINLIF